MKRVLITGTSGFLGRNIAEDLKNRGVEILSISRKEIGLPVRQHVSGDFSDLEALEKLELDGSETLIHLAAVTGDATEEDAMRVNVYETSRLTSFCIEKGIKRFLLASSIATVGCLTKEFMPRALPIRDDHPCDSSNPYGMSKYLMEEYFRYVKLNNPEIEVNLFRIGVVLRPEALTPDKEKVAGMWRPFCTLGCIHLSDVVGAFRHGVENPKGPSFKVHNLVASDVFSSIPTLEALEVSLGDRIRELKLDVYKNADDSYMGIYDISSLINEFGYTPKIRVSQLRAE